MKPEILFVEHLTPELLSVLTDVRDKSYKAGWDDAIAALEHVQQMAMSEWLGEN